MVESETNYSIPPSPPATKLTPSSDNRSSSPMESTTKNEISEPSHVPDTQVSSRSNGTWTSEHNRANDIPSNHTVVDHSVSLTNAFEKFSIVTDDIDNNRGVSTLASCSTNDDNLASTATIGEGLGNMTRIKDVHMPISFNKEIDSQKLKSCAENTSSPSIASTSKTSSSKPSGPLPEDVKRAANVVASPTKSSSSSHRGTNRSIRSASSLSDENRDSHISPSLYCGDLAEDVTESVLMEIFSTVGAIQSVRVCRDVVTRRSLGYAYINFFTVKDAKRALDSLNFFASPLTNMKPLRVMWKIRDPTMRKSGVGNVFVKGLDETVDNKFLYNAFSRFGDILSCKVATSAGNDSLGYGFVHFAASNQAEAAIEGMNGIFLAGRRISVGRFQPRREREAAGHVSTKFTNIYVKNLPDSLCEDNSLRNKFSEFGEITSVHIPKDDDGEPRGFAFINYADVDAAAEAVKQMHEKVIDGFELYVGRAMKRAERDNELRRRKEEARRERSEKYAGVNLYVKNLGDEVDEDKLRSTFEKYGTVASTKIMKDELGYSRGFGFVCFSQAEEATKAVTELNGRLMGAKPIYVALAQHKDARKAQLEAQRAAAQRVRASAVPPSALYAQPSTAAYQTNTAANPYGVTSSPYGGVSSPYGSHLGIPYGQQNHSQSPVRHQRAQQFNGGSATARQARRNRIRPTQDARRGYASPHTSRSVSIGSSVDEHLTLDMLTSVSEKEQKQMLGERLYVRVAQEETVLASKITGMLLELEMTEILHMLEAPEALKEQVCRAVEVLRKHEASMTAVSGSGSV